MAINPIKDKDFKSLKGSISLPNPIKAVDVKIIAFTEESEAKSAIDAGAEEAGLQDLIKRVKDGSVEFDIVIATPTVMPKIAELGKVLGPKGLMPSPKNGTVTENLTETIEEYKKGKTNFQADESGVFHVGVGKVDTDDEKVVENIKYAIQKFTESTGKPAKSIIKSLYIAPTMGVSVGFEYSTKE